jgi:hypothetical protein
MRIWTMQGSHGEGIPWPEQTFDPHRDYSNHAEANVNASKLK